MAEHHLDKTSQGKSAHNKQDAQPEVERGRKPFRLEDADVMDLQRHLGNQATQNVLGVQRKPAAGLPSLPGIVQTKLTVNQPGDQYEQEADKVAHEVMTMPDPVQREEMPEEDELQAKRLQRQDVEEELAMKPLQRQEEEEEMAMPKFLQRQEEEEEVAMKPLQRQEVPEEEEIVATKRLQRQEAMPEEEDVQAKHISSIQRASDVAVPQVTEDMEAQIDNAKGAGQSLPEQTRDFLEPRFGQDFSDVRIHTGAESNDLNNNLQAQAFTTGSDIFFRDGDYSPDSDGGRELLAHELTHVVQQGGSKDLQTKKDDDCC